MIVPEIFFTVSEETRLFLLSCAFGAAFGIFYDIFRTARLLIHHSSFLTAAEDIIFLAVYCIFLSAFASAAALGQVRGCFIIGNILGFSLYIVTLGKVTVGVMKKLTTAAKAVLSLIFKPFSICFAFLCKKECVKFVGNSKVIVNSVKNVKKLLPKPSFMLYNKTENKKRKT
ncbi:MAG: spore cortex biosynthesis protein YabQ [Ruminococcus sp.]|nr:spore cortex biosynthesis protein YabQ [Ruminococcus sp.]